MKKNYKLTNSKIFWGGGVANFQFQINPLQSLHLLFFWGAK